ncbi:MAG TPA: hypothetical protein DD727_07605 [Clostridiales bacterium]|nr:hypothetical protein [Clostridiales bacterium]
MGASKALSRYWYIIAAGVALVIAGSRMYIMSEDGRLKWDDTKMKMPVIKGALTKIYASRFTETMATLLSSGLPLLQTMDITSRVIGNKIISDKILDAREGVRKGLPLSVAVREMQTLPPIVHSMVSVGEESGALDTLLERTARYYDDEVETAIARLVGLVEPVMIVLMAVVVGFVVISIALPMFDMFKTIQ